MLLSPLDGVDLVPEYPELAGRRVLVTGVGSELGLDIVQLLAEQRAHIALAAATDSPETQALAEMIAPIAGDVHLFTGPFADHDAMIRLARNAVQSLGGVDAVINLAEVGEPVGQAGERDVERMVTSLLALPCLVTRVAANRMRTMLTQGTIINIVTTAPRASARAQLVARIARSALASFTRNEAKELAAQGILINAIAPSATGNGVTGLLSGNPDIASLAMHIASGRGSNLSGLVFEAAAG